MSTSWAMRGLPWTYAWRCSRQPAVQVIRDLLTGDEITHRGRHYTVENARLCTIPDQPVPIYVSGFGPNAAAVAREVAGNTDWACALKTVHRKWPTQFLPGELGQVLPDPAHFEQASTLVTEETVADQVVCGDDLEEHVSAVSA